MNFIISLIMYVTINQNHGICQGVHFWAVFLVIQNYNTFFDEPSGLQPFLWLGQLPLNF